MTRCITPVLLATTIVGCTPGDAPGVVDDDILDDFTIATDTAGDQEGLDIDRPDDRALTTDTTGPDDRTIDDFTVAADTTGSDDTGSLDEPAAADP